MGRQLEPSGRRGHVHQVDRIGVPMERDAAHFVHAFDAPPASSPDELTRLLGGKGANLVVMANELGLPVPPGFTITTEACRHYLGGAWPDGLDDEIRAHVERLGERVGRRFGDRDDPLLVSVRSGAPVSMPGMMDTVLNLGLNDATAAGLAAATGDEAFAADCLDRFRQGYRDVIGGGDVPDDPWLQLRAAIAAVFSSWNGERARAYRRHEGIADDLGTAVTVQAMVFGNRGADSGTGVLFTRNPSTGEPTQYGDIMFGAQGEDVVAGSHDPQPLAALDDRMPEAAAELRRHAELLERHYADLCDIEFTLEQSRLWLLQVRVGKRSPRAALRMAIDMAEDVTFPLTRGEAVRRVATSLADPPRVFAVAGERPTPLATGLPASPGVAGGEVVTSPEAAVAAASAGRAVILVRSETSPEDVPGMARSAGVLTTRGGLVSHAAVVARGWGIPAVVGATDVHLRGDAVEIGGVVLQSGDPITIDGSTGEIFAGDLEGSSEIAPEAATLLEWAADHGIEIGAAEAERPDVSATAADGSEASAGDSVAEELSDDDLTRALLVRGSVTPAQLREALLATEVNVERLVASLVEAGTVESSDGTFRLTTEGKLAALALVTDDRRAVGEERTIADLEAFHDLDGRMKEIVTAWQIRDVAGEQTLNDHSDVAYDAQVLDRLAVLHADASEWLASLAAEFRRFAVYRSRLGRALDRAQGGDQRFVASPRVDSYHTVWFELHEDLIRLAGRRRSDEAAAGRA